MTGVDRYRQIVDSRHQYAREWKARTGGRVVGSREPQDITDRHIFPTMWIRGDGCLPSRLNG